VALQQHVVDTCRRGQTVAWRDMLLSARFGAVGFGNVAPLAAHLSVSGYNRNVRTVQGETCSTSAWRFGSILSLKGTEDLQVSKKVGGTQGRRWKEVRRLTSEQDERRLAADRLAEQNLVNSDGDSLVVDTKTWPCLVSVIGMAARRCGFALSARILKLARPKRWRSYASELDSIWSKVPESRGAVQRHAEGVCERRWRAQRDMLKQFRDHVQRESAKEELATARKQFAESRFSESV